MKTWFLLAAPDAGETNRAHHKAAASRGAIDRFSTTAIFLGCGHVFRSKSKSVK
ncbi:MAG: hypothetical protein WDN69_14575 [Aliidongia sp.]